ALLTTILGYFANLGLPRVGEVIRGGTMAQYEGIEVEKVMGTIVLDRIIDVICILTITALAVILQYQTIADYVAANVDFGERFSGGGNLLLIIGGIGIAIVALIYAFRKKLQQSKFYNRVVEIAKGFWQGLLTVSKIKQPGLFIFHTINIWLMYYLMTYLCFLAFPPTAHLGLIAALIVFVFGGWGIVIPSPGGMGTYHFLAQTALMIYGISGEDGFSWANISFFSIQLGCNISVGLLSLIILPIINRNYKPLQPDQIATDASN
ncbi:MAG: lysylphosphatidylglycerol synthase transmembrane domain-containing protein, partial [Bacteroidota bacterium]